MISFPKRVLHFFSNSSASILSTQKRVPISFTVSSKSNKSSLPSDPINWLSSNRNHEVQRFDCSHVARRCPRVGGSARWSRVHRCTGGSHLIRTTGPDGNARTECSATLVSADRLWRDSRLRSISSSVHMPRVAFVDRPSFIRLSNPNSWSDRHAFFHETVVIDDLNANLIDDRYCPAFFKEILFLLLLLLLLRKIWNG